jgi:hypothetical protein
MALPMRSLASLAATRRLAACLLVIVAALAGVAPASASGPAPDSLAPAGAAHNWLPKEGWVWMHWLPFEERELASALGTDAAGIRAYLADDTHRLATLAKRRGWQVKPLARHLTRRFDGRVPRKRLAALRRRAERMLTQGHLAQHVLYHVFHGPAVPANAPALFGITREQFLAARQAALTPDELARRASRDPAAVRAGVERLLTDEAAQGVRTRSQSRAQARRMLSRQRDALTCWMSSPLPKLDPNNPFGGRNGDPGWAPEHAKATAIAGCGGCCSR